uniref:Oxysterol-binding protein-related protein 11-like n=1 Tax=Diabrotica virgifera virgifera TaxID=50390 RepID=A0A6P7GLX3_DIAVI
MTQNKLVESVMDLHTKQRQFSGQLYKYTNVMKGWQYRYFLVDANAGLLHYFLCEGEKPDGTVPRGSVHLAGAVICPSDEDSKTFTVNCASGDMLKLRATDARARQEWVNGLRAVAESHTKVSYYNGVIGSKFFVDPNLLLLKATSAASLHCLTQCMNILQRNQHAQQARTGFVIDDD